MGVVKSLKELDLYPELEKVYEKFVLVPDHAKGLEKLINKHGFTSKEVMVCISTGTKNGFIKPGIYAQLVKLDAKLKEHIPEEEFEEEEKEEIEEEEIEEVVEEKPKRKPRRKKVSSVAQTKVRTPLDKIYRRSSQGFRILKLLREPRTYEELERLAKTNGYTVKRLKSTFVVLNRPSERWYLPKFGWELKEVGIRDGMTQYQIVPLEHKI